MWDVTARQTLTTQTTQISTHTSRVGCDTQPVPGTCAAGFLLTHPVWDVTWIAYIGRSNDEFLLTHPVWDVTAIYSIFQSHYSHILQDGPIIHLELY